MMIESFLELTKHTHGLEILVEGEWFPASVQTWRYGGSRTGVPGVGWTSAEGEYGTCRIAFWRKLGGPPTLLDFDQDSIRGRMRYRVSESQNLSIAEIDKLREIGTDELRRRYVAIPTLEFEALCRTARAAVSSPTDVLRDVVKAAKLDWRETTPLTVEEVAKRYQWQKEHADKLANALNGPTGAAAVLQSTNTRLAVTEKQLNEARQERDKARHERDQAASKLPKVEERLARYDAGEHVLTEELRADLFAARKACQRIREERDRAVELQTQAATALRSAQNQIAQERASYRAGQESVTALTEANVRLREQVAKLEGRNVNWRSEIPPAILERLRNLVESVHYDPCVDRSPGWRATVREIYDDLMGHT